MLPRMHSSYRQLSDQGGGHGPLFRIPHLLPPTPPPLSLSLSVTYLSTLLGWQIGGWFRWRGSILDLHSGALSMGKQVSGLYRHFREQIMDVFSEEDVRLNREVRGRIQAVVATTFDLDPPLLYLTEPTFFSRVNSTLAKTQQDEHWHLHIDKNTTVGSQPWGTRGPGKRTAYEIIKRVWSLHMY
uniref:2-oxoglutarate and iron dependent oxygenase domain containing 3 n=1 Tax=Oncorhynchus mykiss TaxID=8022 RepID=A0A8K9X8I1_ONCMY